MDKSENIDGLAAALAKAQAQIEGAAKDKANPFFKSKYADLSSVVAAIQKPLAAVGLSYTQIIHDAENAAKVETVIMHSSGQWISCGVISVPVSKADAQGLGSAMTYARRYSLSAAFGVAPEDDDGNAAAAAKPANGAKMPSGPITPTTGAKDHLTPEEIKEAEAVASTMVDWMSEGSVTDAVLAMENSKLHNDQRIYVWTFFDSKSRSAMKKEHERIRKEAADKLIPQQA